PRWSDFPMRSACLTPYLSTAVTLLYECEVHQSKQGSRATRRASGWGRSGATRVHLLPWSARAVDARFFGRMDRESDGAGTLPSSVCWDGIRGAVRCGTQDLASNTCVCAKGGVRGATSQARVQ